ncbi:MAG: hypothetical protein AAF957_07295 [Planctomycetota bacterium]
MHDPLRPTFEKDIPGVAPDVLSERIAAALSAPEGLPYRRAGHHFLVWLPEGKRHMWSPWLHLDVNEVEGEPSRTALFGRFTPAPSMWTAVMFSYLALGVLALGGGLFGYCQWIIDQEPWGLWFLPVTGLIALMILLFSRAGQSIAREQMGDIVSVVEDALGAPI